MGVSDQTEMMKRAEVMSQPYIPANKQLGDLGAIQQALAAQPKPEAVDPKQGAADTKPQPQFVPFALLAACDEALAEGRVKYGVAKWRGVPTKAMTYAGAVLRHMYAWLEGEEIDPESLVGKRHLAGAAASLAILLDCIQAGTLVDDRPTAAGGAKLTRAKGASK